MRIAWVVVVFSFLSATAQPQPVLSVAVATDTQSPIASTRVLADWNSHNVFVVSDRITVVDNTGTIVDTHPMVPPTGTDIFGDACVSSDGLIATVWGYSGSAAQLPVAVQTIRYWGPGNWGVKTLNLGLSYPKKFDLIGHCAFAPDGTLWLGADSFGDQTTPKIVHIDVNQEAVIGSWRTDKNAIVSVAVTPDGTPYFGTWYPYTSLSAGIGTIGTDGAYRLLTQQAPARNGYLAMTPNGRNLIQNGKVFDQTGQLMSDLQAPLAATFAWPSQDPWHGYGCGTNALGGIELYNQRTNPPAGSGINLIPGQAAYNCIAVTAHRNADGTDTVIAGRASSNTLTYLDFFQVTPPPLVHFVANGASFAPEALTPGEHITLMGQGLTAALDEYDVAGLQVATQLGKTKVLFDYKPVRLDFAQYGQVNARVPSNATPGTHVIAVVVDGTTVAITRVTVVDQAEAIFLWHPDPNHWDITMPILTDGGVHLIGDPGIGLGYAQVSPGDVFIAWGTGGGATSPLEDDTVVSPSGLYYLVNQLQVLVDGTPATIAYAGRAPGYGSLDQLNVMVPSGLAPGPHDVTVVSQGGHTVAYPKSLWVK